MSGEAFFWIVGFWMGFAYRCWGVHRERRHDLPAWVTRFAVSLSEQVDKLEQAHRFAGDDIIARSTATYQRGEQSYRISVQRCEREAA